MSQETLKLIANPAAGGKKAADVIPQLERSLGEQGISVNTSLTTKIGDGTKLAAAARQGGYENFGVVGGDGTVNEVVNGLVQAARPDQQLGQLAIFPAGSGNDLASTLELQADPQQFAQRITNEQTKSVDICTVTVDTPDGQIQRHFVNNLGIGLEAAVTQRYQQVKWVQGHLRYVVAALQTISSYQATTLSATWTDVAAIHQDADSALPSTMTHGITSHAGGTMLVTVGNNRRAGGGFYLTPDAQLDDGYIDVGILRSVKRLPLLKLLAQALQGKHTHDPNITMLRTPMLSISCDAPLPIQADGELLATDATEINISIHSEQLQLYA